MADKPKRLRPASTVTEKDRLGQDGFVPIAVSIDEPNIIDQYVAARVVIGRQEAGLSKTGAALKMGVSRTTYLRWESGHSRISVSNLYAIAHLVAKPVSWFFDGLPGLLEHASVDESVNDMVTGESLQMLRYFTLLDQRQKNAVLALIQGCVEGIIGRVGLGDDEEDEEGGP